MENKVTVLHYQSLLDICLQTTGSIEGIFAFALLNGMSITDLPEPGNILSIPVSKEDGNEALGDDRILNYYRAHDIRPVTGLKAGGNGNGGNCLFAGGMFEAGLFASCSDETNLFMAGIFENGFFK